MWRDNCLTTYFVGERVMKPKSRFIRSVVKAAQDCDTQFPWAHNKRSKPANREAQAARKSA
jgi:hypothetical protein